MVVFPAQAGVIPDAIRIFLEQALREQRMPFTPSADTSRTYRGIPMVGYIDADGRTVLPADWNDPGDDDYG